MSEGDFSLQAGREEPQESQHPEADHAGGDSPQTGEDWRGGILHRQVSVVEVGLFRPQTHQAGGADRRGQDAPHGQARGGAEGRSEGSK